ncbi:DNA topoisomerase (ATP-hydrolyzing) subunit B [Cellulomonas hominis]|uniref:DNA gyrase subunit B n=1 Tax=Cellulomonas hominis TaxID=156981 RepID=A0A511FHX7_9CELL|nr:DNA topoisomerase (ATP-hydrolyzing) subunit B [Cellulomonas hominis]NKY06541.1 DNA topoisomerase (ATP-hydrolyzing) subunit B [Cellulomonas hominis]NKY10782.1 DNA topoisomerase (ATP-hydrolyzing) subunit B [Cellulomonas hominis]GEL48823.1 DNA gyrase subunit B [Cellulomonas hominis]
MADQSPSTGPNPTTPGGAVNGTPAYDASAITVLEGLEAVRKRPGMYIGSTGERGLHHLVYEVVDNSVDEALAGYCDHIEVTLLADGGVRVVDNGRGIPVAIHPTEGRPTVEVVMTILHAGGKFGGGGYAVSGGLHGVGISVVNALSTKVQTVVKRDGFAWEMDFADGGKPASELRKGEATTDTGTSQTFWADPSIFETVEFDFETLRSRFQQMAFLNKGLQISLTDERPQHTDTDDEVAGSDGVTEAPSTARKVTYKYDGGLVDYVKHLNSAKKVDLVHPEVIDFEAEDTERKISVEVAMQWTSAYSESVHTYANTISTTEGGTHEEGFRAAMTSLVNRYARDKGILKDKDDNLTGDDIREGLTAVVSIKLGEPQFEGQTKTKLGNTEAKTFVQRVVNEQFGDWLDSHPNEARDVIRKAIQASQARLAARKAREATRRKGLLESNSMPGKLKDCQSNNPAECEIFIVEGDSAGGSAVRGRNPQTQAILPLRGKILNVERARLDRALGNAEVQALITAFGTGIGEDFDISKLRYHKIVLMADADVDGQHIRTLLLTLLYRYMPELILKGHVYMAQPPLFRIKWSNSPHDYVYSDRERDAVLADGQANGKRIPKENGIQRYKGLGEMDYSELWETTMAPEHRTLLQVTLDEAAAADEIFSVLMGEDVESRRSFIQRNARDVRFLDI